MLSPINLDQTQFISPTTSTTTTTRRPRPTTRRPRPTTRRPRPTTTTTRRPVQVWSITPFHSIKTYMKLFSHPMVRPWSVKCFKNISMGMRMDLILVTFTASKTAGWFNTRKLRRPSMFKDTSECEKANFWKQKQCFWPWYYCLCASPVETHGWSALPAGHFSQPTLQNATLSTLPALHSGQHVTEEKLVSGTPISGK